MEGLAAVVNHFPEHQIDDPDLRLSESRFVASYRRDCPENLVQAHIGALAKAADHDCAHWGWRPLPNCFAGYSGS